jgi:hypothetical protein
MYVITETSTYKYDSRYGHSETTLTVRLLEGFFSTQEEAEERIKELSSWDSNTKKIFICHSLTPIKRYCSTDFK